MNIHIHSQHHGVTAAVHERIASRIQHALGPLAARVGDVTVHLRTAHGSRGEVHTHCRILATLPASQQVIVESIAGDPEQAVACVSTHLFRAVQNLLTIHCQSISCVPITARIAASALLRRRASA